VPATPPLIEIELRLPNDRHAPSLARRAIAVLSDRLPRTVLEGARLLTSELVTNAVRHSGLAERDAMTMRVELGRRLRIEVTDVGSGFRWGRFGATDPMRGDGGLGFLMIAELAERWGVETGPPTRVWFELDPRRPFDLDHRRVSTQPTTTRREGHMDEKRDETKGRIKEATGTLTGDDDLKREGKMDRAGATVKEKTGNAVERTKEAVNDVTRDDT
jgi:uncharacterized protein YjbJ (UPF0337 family)/anti-sigma regulatory factor (Ser/Thr protein kinase)